MHAPIPSRDRLKESETFGCRHGTIGNERLVKLRKIVGRVRVLHQNEIDPGTCGSRKNKRS